MAALPEASAPTALVAECFPRARARHGVLRYRPAPRYCSARPAHSSRCTPPRLVALQSHLLTTNGISTQLADGHWTLSLRSHGHGACCDDDPRCIHMVHCLFNMVAAPFLLRASPDFYASPSATTRPTRPHTPHTPDPTAPDSPPAPRDTLTRTARSLPSYPARSRLHHPRRAFTWSLTSYPSLPLRAPARALLTHELAPLPFGTRARLSDRHPPPPSPQLNRHGRSWHRPSAATTAGIWHQGSSLNARPASPCDRLCLQRPRQHALQPKPHVLGTMLSGDGFKSLRIPQIPKQLAESLIVTAEL